MRTHVTRTRVRFGETDAAGIVFYPTFYAWFDMGTSGLLRAAAGPLLQGAVHALNITARSPDELV